MKKIEKQIETYLDYCLKAKNLSPKTIELYREALYDLIADTGVRSIEKLTCREVENHLASRSWSASNSNRHLIALKTAFKWFKQHGYKVKVKNELLERVKEPERRVIFYTKEQIEEVLESCDTLTWLLIRLSFEGGLRIRELTNLKPSDIEGNCIKFIGKGRKRREVYISDGLRIALDSWVQKHPSWEFLWMWEVDGECRQYCPNGLRQRMRKAFAACGYDDFHPHALRHSFATHILHEGAPIDVVKDMMGHTKIRTTMRYIHQLDGQLEEAFMKYGAY